ncbi:hypothetical protein AXH82_13670 [Microbacterium sp. PAMC 28756]|nr:hypothetical protein AXH82_13670 [Microbacterium sp. PAMC 28756]
MRLSRETLLSIRLDAVCSRNRYTKDPAPVVDELRATASIAASGKVWAARTSASCRRPARSRWTQRWAMLRWLTALVPCPGSRVEST